MGAWKKLCCILCLFLWASAFATTDEAVKHDNSIVSVFLQPSISFLNFEERDYFQYAIDTIYKEFRSTAVTSDESLSVAKQNFQKVNFCFPVTAGLQFQVFQDNFISAGIGFIYDNESVVLTDRKNNTHNYSYTLQGVPLFLEYRLAIPLNLMTLTDGGLFSVALRWYWTLPGTEIYTTWGKIEAENSPLGAGFGFSVGYLIASVKGINIFGDIGFSSIKVKSKESFAKIVPDGSIEKAKWDIGGLQMQIRVSFGVWNKPKVEEDSTKKKTDSLAVATDSSAIDSTRLVNDTAAVAKDSTAAIKDSSVAIKDSSAAVTDSASVVDSVSVIKDSAAVANDSAAIAKDSTVKNAAVKNSAAKNESAQSSAAKNESAPAKKEKSKGKDSANKPAAPVAKEQ
ncbi:MAG: hypothetical protein MJY82_07245 [Fibrobacter sp.]|nr:hypothetical protein [Fibrobacter sp.]